MAPEAARRADRRLRGRLPAPVTIWTAGGPEAAVGLTVSSVVVAEGDPARLLGVVDPLSDLGQGLATTGRFLVHVLGEEDRRLAVRFAGGYPGDPFDGLEVSESPHGPRLAGRRTVVACSAPDWQELGYQALVVATVDSIDLGEDAPPLLHYRGRYGALRTEA